MHRGCFMWTPTPPLSRRRMPRPGPVRVCVCVLCLVGSGGRASRARSGAPHLFLWHPCPCSLFGPLRASVAPFAVCFFFFSLSAPPLSPAFRVLRPGVPWSLASCSRPPPLFLFLSFFFSAPPPGFFFLLLGVLFPAFFFSRLCGAVSVCVLVAVGCAGVWCCWRCSLWCVVCFAWCCVACLCFAGFSCFAVRRSVALGLVGLFLLCSSVACCCVLCWCFFFALFRAFPWWSLLFWSVWCSVVVCLAVWRGPVALRSCAGFCCAVPFGALPCRGASLGSVLCCLFRCCAWVASCLVRCCGVLLCSVCPWARCCVVLLCCLASVCCRSLCRVSGCLPFSGAACVVLCWCACVVALCAVLSHPSGAG